MRTLLILWSATFVASIPPPYAGTVWVSREILTADDVTAYTNHEYLGQQQKTIYDRRPPSWITVNAYVFRVYFGDQTTADFVVNPEFGSPSASEVFVSRYAPAIGQLSTSMREDVREVWINGGDAPAGGGNNAILLHTEYADRHLADGYLEEVLIHESGHTSFDAKHAQSAGWVAAQAADAEYISVYARDYPTREDISESLLLYYAYRHRPTALTRRDFHLIGSTMPNRIAYFDALDLDWYPMVTTTNKEANASTIDCTIGAFPNPFEDVVHFESSCLGEDSIMSLRIHDMQGRLVSVAKHSNLWRGQSTLDGLVLPAGRYVATVTVNHDGHVVNRSIVVIKQAP